MPGQRPHRLVERRLTDLVAPFQRVEPPDEDMKNTNVDARFAVPGALGHVRLWAGMVLANRPWKLFPSFKGAIAAAFATAAYVLVNPTLLDVSRLGRLGAAYGVDGRSDRSDGRVDHRRTRSVGTAQRTRS